MGRRRGCGSLLSMSDMPLKPLPSIIDAIRTALRRATCHGLLCVEANVGDLQTQRNRPLGSEDIGGGYCYEYEQWSVSGAIWRAWRFLRVRLGFGLLFHLGIP